LAAKGGAPFVLVLVLALAAAGPAKKRYEEPLRRAARAAGA